MSRRPILALTFALVAVGVLAAIGVWFFQTPAPPAGATRGERLYLVECAHCHGTDGRGSWRARLFMIRPGDFTDPAQMGQASDHYLREIIKSGGSPLGRPGMPAFPDLSDEDVTELIRYVRSFSKRG